MTRRRRPRQLAGAARALADALATHAFSRAETFAALDAVLSGAAARYTDYEGGAQAVMAADTLLNSLVAQGAGGPRRRRKPAPADQQALCRGA